MNAHIIDILR